MPATRSTPVRLALTCFAFALVCAGITTTITLIARTATSGNCGPRWYAACEPGRGELSLGVLAVLLGGMLLDRMRKSPGRTGPVDGVAALVLGYGLLGAAAAFAIPVFLPGPPIGWRIMLGAFTLFTLFFAYASTAGFVQEARAIGVGRQFARTAWYLDVAADPGEREAHPRRKDETVARLVLAPGERGTVLGFYAGMLVAAAGGVAAGRWFVALVSAG